MQRLKTAFRWIVFAISVVLLVLPACMIRWFAETVLAVADWWVDDAASAVFEWLAPSDANRGRVSDE